MTNKHNETVIDNDFDVFDEYSEELEKLEKLSDTGKRIIETISAFLLANFGYKESDLDNEFKVDKLIPLIKPVKNKDVTFADNKIILQLRVPLELKNQRNEVVRSIESLEFKSRYQDLELQKATKGINPEKEMMKYIAAQIGVVTDQPTAVISKLWNIDSGLAKNIIGLYFLG